MRSEDSTNSEYPDLKAVARLVQTMLYGKRFFPFYTVRVQLLPSLVFTLISAQYVLLGEERLGGEPKSWELREHEHHRGETKKVDLLKATTASMVRRILV